MKRNIEIIIVAVLLGLIFVKAMFSTYQNEQVMTLDGNIYLLQYGSYINKEVMQDNLNKLNDYITYEDDNKYYVFVGAFINLENALKLQNILNNQNIYTYIKNDYISDNKIIKEIEKYDEEAIKTDDEDKIIKLNKNILSILKSVS